MFSRGEIEEIIFQTIQIHVKKGVPVAHNSRIIADLGLKHDYVYLDIDLEKKFQVKIPDSEFSQIHTVEDLVDLYCKYLNIN